MIGMRPDLIVASIPIKNDRVHGANTSPSDPPSSGLSDRGSPASLSEPKASLEAGRLDSLERGEPVDGDPRTGAGPGRRTRPGVSVEGALLCLLSYAFRKVGRLSKEIPGRVPGRTPGAEVALRCWFKCASMDKHKKTLGSRLRGNDEIFTEHKLPGNSTHHLPPFTLSPRSSLVM